MLCSYCENIPHELHHLREYRILALFDETNDSLTARLKHHPEWSSLQHSADLGCKLCHLFVSAIIRNKRHREEANEWGAQFEKEDLTNQSIQLQLYTELYENDEFDSIIIEVQSFRPSKSGRPNLWEGRVLFFASPGMSNAKSCFFNSQNAVAEVEAATGGYIIRRPISLDPASNLCLQLAQQWIDTCKSTHMGCQQGYPPELPTRLIDVQSEKIVLTSARRGRYITLSHVWGGAVSLRLTTDTVAKFSDSLPYEMLPRTFQDAFLVTKKLGIRFLWIDALCIIQDSKQDWEIESARMGSIYQNSFITIAAPDAGKSDDGLFGRGRHPPEFCTLPFYNPEGEPSGSIYLREYDTIEDVPDIKTTTLLSNRAWVLQERYLSTRILYFGAYQMYWECNTNEHYEQFGMRSFVRNSGRTPDQGSKRPKAQFFEQIRDGRSLFSNRYNSIHLWSDVVRQYSRRNLSFPEDKLPALSGCASIMEASTGYTYLAGLWKEYLIPQLLWEVDQSGQLPPSTSSTVYRAPSWSWASADGEISFEIAKKSPDDLEERCQVVDVNTTLAGRDPYGQVVAGSLTITARKRVVEIRPRDQQSGNFFNIFSPGSGQVQQAKCYLDDADLRRKLLLSGTDGGIECLGAVAVRLASYYDTFESYANAGLLLKRVDDIDDSTYRRIGTARFERLRTAESGFFAASYEEKTITII